MARISSLTLESIESEGPANELLQTSADEQRRAARTAVKFTEEELTRFLHVMLRTFDELGYRQEPRFHFELGLLKLVHLRRLLPMEEVLSRLPQSPAGPSPTASRPRSGTPAQALSVSGSSTSTTSPTSPVPSKAAFSPLQQNSARWSERSTESVLASTKSSNADVATPTQAPRPSLAGEAQKGDSLAPVAPIEEHANHIHSLDGPTLTKDQTNVAQLVATENPTLATEQLKAANGELLRQLRDAVGEALTGAKSQSSAADAIEDAEWLIKDGSLSIQTGLSPTMLPMVINAEAEKIVRAALREAGSGALRLELLPGKPKAKSEAKRPRGRSGLAQAKAEQHPIVQQAQKLFHAEIRNVIDLTEGK